MSLKRAVFVVVVVVVVIVEWTMVDTGVCVCLFFPSDKRGVTEAWIQDTGHWRGRKDWRLSSDGRFGPGPEQKGFPFP